MKNEKICYIVGAGEDYGLDFVPGAEDYVIAADGGYDRLLRAGIVPQLVIGDFDSLGRIPQAEHVLTLPREKDVTDTWAAIEQGKARGYRTFWLYGCTGGRIEHTLANIQTLMALAEANMTGVLVDQHQLITAMGPGTRAFPPSARGYVSVFAASDRCSGVWLRGLKYELSGGTLTNRFPLGVSNEFQGLPSSVTVGEGVAILVFDRDCH